MIEHFHGKTILCFKMPQVIQLLAFIYAKDRQSTHPPITLERLVKTHQEDGEPTYTVEFNYDDRFINADDLLDSLELCPAKIKGFVIPHSTDRLIRDFPHHQDRNRNRTSPLSA